MLCLFFFFFLYFHPSFHIFSAPQSSICHVEFLVLSPRSSSLVPLVILKPLSPSPSDQVRKCSSDDSDSESESEAESLSGSRSYKEGLLSWSVAGPQSTFSSNQSPQSEQTQPTAEVQPTVTTHPSLDFMDTHSSNVDLLTLTCGHHQYHEEEEQEDLHLQLTNHRAMSGCSTNSISSQEPEMWDVGQKTVFFSDTEEVREEEEEEEEGQESSGYLGRVLPDPSKHFKS